MAGAAIVTAASWNWAGEVSPLLPLEPELELEPLLPPQTAGVVEFEVDAWVGLSEVPLVIPFEAEAGPVARVVVLVT